MLSEVAEIMMKLSTMKKVWDTGEGIPIAERILQRWGFDSGTVRFFRASANFVYTFSRLGRRYFLRFNDACEREFAMIEAEIAILQYLSRQAVRVAEPVASRNGQWVERVETEHGTFYAVVFQELQGDFCEQNEMNHQQMKDWGRALGNLHQTLKTMPKSCAIGRLHWRDHLDFIRETFIHEDRAALLELERVGQWAEGLELAEEDYGIIHYDFETDNLCWNDGEASILDFDDCAFYAYVADIGYALRDLWDGKVNSDDPRFAAFLEGYTQVTKVNTNLLRELPWFMRLHDLHTCARLIRSLDLPAIVESPAWMPGLVGKLQRYVENDREGFRRLHPAESGQHK